jgi:putative nucleotidyltransferase with HDIG domain
MGTRPPAGVDAAGGRFSVPGEFEPGVARVIRMGPSAGSPGPERSARVTAMPEQISREDAWNLLCEWTKSDSLRRHMLAVEAAMRAYAPRFGGDVELWGLTGLMHDLDYERYPNLEDGHPRYAIRELMERGYPDELVRAVASHADFMGVPRETAMEKALYAVDELCGFVLAVAYVRPEGLVGMTPKSVKKKLKQPSFAAAVNREELRHGAEELGVDFDEHLAIVIDALNERRDELIGAGAAAS